MARSYGGVESAPVRSGWRVVPVAFLIVAIPVVIGLVLYVYVIEPLAIF